MFLLDVTKITEYLDFPGFLFFGYKNWYISWYKPIIKGKNIGSEFKIIDII